MRVEVLVSCTSNEDRIVFNQHVLIAAWVKYEPIVALPPPCSWEDQGDDLPPPPVWKPLSPIKRADTSSVERK